MVRRTIKVGVISNIAIEPFWKDKIDINKDITVEFYFILHSDLLNNLHFDYDLNKCDYIVVWFNLQNAIPDIDSKICQGLGYNNKQQIIKFFNNVVKKFDGKQIIFVSLEDYYSYLIEYIPGGCLFDGIVQYVNNYIYCNLSKEYYVIDLPRIIASTGKSEAYSQKNNYRWQVPYSAKLIEYINNKVIDIIYCENCSKIKCIVVDCDNVLWKGTLVEDGISGIKIGNIGEGRHYESFQRLLLSLYHRGIILAVCSKNDLQDVLDVFENHSGMLLKKEHISYFAVNWKNKADNIIEISKALNINLDSLVFVDDSVFEVNLVKNVLPNNQCILFDVNKIYDELSFVKLNSKIDINQAMKRQETYKTNIKRNSLMNKSLNYFDYLDKLDTKVDIHVTTESEIFRLSELSMRTNKFTNGFRQTVTDIKEKYKNSDIYIYTVEVSDIFSDLGLVGMIMINKNFLEGFILSCRVIGRNIEDRMIDFILHNHKISNFYFNDTGKNKDVKKLLSNKLNIKERE